MWLHTSLCGCMVLRYPIDWLGKELAIRWCAAMKEHYKAQPQCALKATEDIAWQDKKPV